MPSLIRSCSPRRNGITKLTNCRVLRGGDLVWDDVWVSSVTGKIVRSQSAFYDELTMPDEVIDLGGRIVSPGFIECQLNGAYGFNFSTVVDDMTQYGKQLRELNKKLAQTGVTSYVPTVTSQTSDLYKKVLPYLGQSGSSRCAHDGAESLGAHVEGPFLNPTKNGVHNTSALRIATSFADLEDMYGVDNITPDSESNTGNAIPVKMITAAPEQGAMTELIPELTRRGIIVAIGHSEATYEEASAAVSAGATMITHLFNAMRPLHHRNPGIFGVLGATEPPTATSSTHNNIQVGEGTCGTPKLTRPYFGLICDGIHLHPATVKIAWHAHPAGLILVTDAMHMVGLPDGRYPWTNGEGEHFIVKKGSVLELEGTGVIAGSTTILTQCLSNFLNYTGASLPQALATVTSTPAAMLGVQGVKGTLDPGADADLVVLSERISTGSGTATPESPVAGGGQDAGKREVVVDEVWKFGVRIYRRDGDSDE